MSVIKGRMTAAPGDDGTVLFLIGMRINSLWRVWQWVPVFAAMPRMIAELMRHRELGLLGRPRTFLSGRTILVWQYWASFEQLEAYSRSTENAHLPAWRDFNRRIRNSGTVGIFHETVRLNDANTETVYANMPLFGLGAARGIVPAHQRGQSARGRMTGSENEPPIAPY